MDRKPFIAGNWKMNLTTAASAELARSLVRELGEVDGVDVAIAPPFTSLSAVGGEVSGSPVGLAAQNVHWESSGAYTGEISTAMLAAVGCEYVIIGHSERRAYFHEDDGIVNNKLKAVVAAGLKPIVCLGETLEEREAGRALDVISGQLSGALSGLRREELGNLVLAYEPVWAIGTGRTASPAQAQEVHAFIRERLGIMCGADFALGVRIQYGGSVKPSNVDELMAEKDVDGALVGGASLDAESFARIVKFKS